MVRNLVRLYHCLCVEDAVCPINCYSINFPADVSSPAIQEGPGREMSPLSSHTLLENVTYGNIA